MQKNTKRPRTYIIIYMPILLLVLASIMMGCRSSREDGAPGQERPGTALPVLPSQREDPGLDYWNYTSLGEVSNRQRMRYCRMSDGEWATFYQEQSAEAEDLSQRLEEHIQAWHAGREPADLPPGLLPSSIENAKTPGWTLYHPDEITPEEQWYVRPAHKIPPDFSELFFLGPDNHVTYMKLVFLAPLNSELIVEGEFPYARFMNYQILPPFDPEFPTNGGFGAPEVPIVDVDIEPEPGHTNPFWVGADRNATQRSYRLTFQLKAGNAVDLNPEAMRAPTYRAPGNMRVGGPFAASGPIGDGQLVASVLWLRYYAPDHRVGPLGGVPIPKATLRLKSGETFWLKPDLDLVTARQTVGVPGFETRPEEPPQVIGPSLGWLKMYGIWLILADGRLAPLARPYGFLPKRWAEDLITRTDACFFNRGPAKPPPGNLEPTATTVHHNSYLVRTVWLGESKVYALTGKLPQAPQTRNGEPTMTAGDVRYWSICRAGNGENGHYPGLLYGCLMDDEVTVNEDGNFIIVYSRDEDRPANARPECGVTWQAFGPESRQILNLRWMSVRPDHYLPAYAPHEDKIPWEVGEWSQPTWDRNLMGYNNQDGFMGPYQPLIHYLSTEEFNSLGCPIRPAQVPVWE